MERFPNVTHDDALCISDGDRLERLITFEASEENELLRNKYVKKKELKTSFINAKTYVSGLVERVLTTKEALRGRNGVRETLKGHIDFLAFLGLPDRDILFTLFTLGYRCVTLVQVRDYLDSTAGIRIKRLQKKFMEETELLKKKVFQDMAGDILNKEKEYLQALLKRLPALYEELDDLDPILEPAKWKRVNNLIRDVLEQAKEMHGIDLYRETVVKAEGAIAVNNARPDNAQALPIATRPREALGEGSGIIELEEERTVIKDV